MFVDTNVLVHASVPAAPDREKARAALSTYAASGETLCINRQVLREFPAVITRPQTWILVQTTTEAAVAAEVLARDFDILEDGPAVWDQILDLCRRFDFGGRQVHDANIVATMLAHGESRLLTFNGGDFRRFGALIQVIAP
jgi:predicted nucleic acid-binding protein